MALISFDNFARMLNAPAAFELSFAAFDYFGVIAMILVITVLLLVVPTVTLMVQLCEPEINLLVDINYDQFADKDVDLLVSDINRTLKRPNAEYLDALIARGRQNAKELIEMHGLTNAPPSPWKILQIPISSNNKEVSPPQSDWKPCYSGHQQEKSPSPRQQPQQAALQSKPSSYLFGPFSSPPQQTPSLSASPSLLTPTVYMSRIPLLWSTAITTPADVSRSNITGPKPSINRGKVPNSTFLDSWVSSSITLSASMLSAANKPLATGTPAKISGSPAPARSKVSLHSSSSIKLRGAKTSTSHSAEQMTTTSQQTSEPTKAQTNKASPSQGSVLSGVNFSQELINEVRSHLSPEDANTFSMLNKHFHSSTRTSKNITTISSFEPSTDVVVTPSHTCQQWEDVIELQSVVYRSLEFCVAALDINGGDLQAATGWALENGDLATMSQPMKDAMKLQSFVQLPLEFCVTALANHKGNMEKAASWALDNFNRWTHQQQLASSTAADETKRLKLAKELQKGTTLPMEWCGIALDMNGGDVRAARAWALNNFRNVSKQTRVEKTSQSALRCLESSTTAAATIKTPSSAAKLSETKPISPQTIVTAPTKNRSAQMVQTSDKSIRSRKKQPVRSLKPNASSSASTTITKPVFMDDLTELEEQLDELLKKFGAKAA